MQKISWRLTPLLLLYLVACGEKPQENPQPGLLTNGASKDWKIVSLKQNDITFPPGGCNLGDVYTFYADGKISVDEGSEKCNPNDPQTLTGTWHLENSIITIRNNNGSAYAVLRIKSLSTSTLVANRDNNDQNPVEITFAAQ